MMNVNWLLAQDDNGGGAMALIPAVIFFALLIVAFAAVWKVYTKAGKPGWAAIIPIYGQIVLLEMTGKPLWWIVLFCIPCVQIIAFILVFIALAKSFGKSDLFGVGLAFLPFIFFPILAFGDAKYIGPQSA